MRGNVVRFDPSTASGTIAGNDGIHYRFFRADWPSEEAPMVGAEVSFEAGAAFASAIRVVEAGVPSSGGLTLPGLFFQTGGRIGRRTWLLGSVLPFLLLHLIALATAPGIDPDADPIALLAIALAPATLEWALLVTVLAVILTTAPLVKRLHDRNRSGWFTLVGLIPVAGWLWLLIECCLLPGTRGPNRYGAGPLGFGR